MQVLEVEHPVGTTRRGAMIGMVLRRGDATAIVTFNGGRAFLRRHREELLAFLASIELDADEERLASWFQRVEPIPQPAPPPLTIAVFRGSRWTWVLNLSTNPDMDAGVEVLSLLDDLPHLDSPQDMRTITQLEGGYDVAWMPGNRWSLTYVEDGEWRSGGRLQAFRQVQPGRERELAVLIARSESGNVTAEELTREVFQVDGVEVQLYSAGE